LRQKPVCLGKDGKDDPVVVSGKWATLKWDAVREQRRAAVLSMRANERQRGIFLSLFCAVFRAIFAGGRGAFIF